MVKKFKLTKRSVDALTSTDKDCFVWDSGIPGFGMKLNRGGTKTYIVQARIQGRSRRFTIGRHGSPWTPETARKRALAILGFVSQGIDPSGQQPRDKEISISHLMDRYFEEGCRSKKQRTIKNELSFSKRHIKPLLGSKSVRKLKSTDIERYMQDVAAGKTRVDEKLGHRSRAIVTGGKGVANRSRDLLSSALSFAVRQGYRTDNPALGVRNYKMPPRERFLTPEEYQRLGQTFDNAVRDGVNPYAIAALRVLTLSGARSGEIISLQRRWIDEQVGGARLPDSKTGARFLILPAPAIAIIRDVLDMHDNNFVFPGRSGTKPYGGLKKVWLQMREQAGLDDVRLHDLRHSYASIAVAGGASLFIVGKVLGHNDPATTKRYAHIARSPIKIAADEISLEISGHLLRSQ